MEDFIFLFAGVKSVSVTSIVCKFLHDGRLSIISPNGLIFDHDFVALALLDESVILVVSDLAFFSSLKFLIRLLFNHGSVGVQVLSLKSDLLQFLSETCLFSSFLLLLLVNLSMRFEETFFSCGLLLRC